MKNNQLYIGILAVILLLTGGYIIFNNFQENNNKPDKTIFPTPTPIITINEITNFNECVTVGNPIMESYPRQCNANGKNFVEDVDNAKNEVEKTNMIVVLTPIANQIIQSPLIVNGQARGNWFFEANFPVYLYDSNNNKISTGIAQAQGDWMTEEFVPFTTTLTYTSPKTTTGYLVIEKSNPSGLPENADSLRIPIRFK